MSWNRQDAIALLLLGFWLVLFIIGAANAIQGADNADFLATAGSWGIAHPSGYPLYTLLNGFALQISPLSIPKTLGILAAIFSFLMMVGCYKLLRILTRSRAASFLGAGFSGLSLHVWKQSGHAEAFSLLGCFTAWLLYFAYAGSQKEATEKERKRFWLFYTLFAGLASTHHQTIVLTAPAGIFLLYRLFLSKETRVSAPASAFFMGCVAFLVGLTPLSYLFVVGNEPSFVSWGEVTTFSDFVSTVFRQEFGTFSSGLYQNRSAPGYHSVMYLSKAFSPTSSFPFGLSVFWLMGLILSLLSIWNKSRTFKPAMDILKQFEWSIHTTKGGIFALLSSWVICGLLFPILLKMGTGPLDEYIVSRFFLLPDVYLGVFAGIGFSALLVSARSFWNQRQKTLIYGMIGIQFTAGLTYQFHKTSLHKAPWLENYLRDILEELPPNALLLEAGDDVACFGIPYLQHVLQIRKDVRFVCLPHLARKWYILKLKRHWPEFAYTWRARKISSLALIQHYRKLGKPVHTTELYNQSIQRAFLWAPYGLSWQALPPKKHPPAPYQVEKRLAKRFSKLRKSEQKPHPEYHPWVVHHTFKRYATPWLTLANVYKQNRQRKAAIRCYKRAQEWLLTPIRVTKKNKKK